MSIEKHTTEAFILKEYERSENDFVYKVWTKDFGIIFVLAKSIRKINAKLRMNSKKNEFLNITLVKGKDIWRLTGVGYGLGIYIEENETLIKIKYLIGEIINRFLEENKSYKKLFERLKSIYLDTNFQKLEIKKIQLLIYYIVLVDTGYADAKIIGVKDLESYKKLSSSDIYVNFILNEEEIKKHTKDIINIVML